jgi:serine/threonine protein kinase
MSPESEQRVNLSPEEASAPSGKLDFLMPAQQPDELGRLGHYRILKILGKGGMGLVFLAVDTKLDRQVALKVMLPKYAEDTAAKQRFLREAKMAAKIDHDYIVHIYQVDEDRGVPFLAMQLLSGCSLEDVLRRASALTAARLTVPQLLRLGAQIAEGLAVAHAKGLIHRDIKPANIWIEVDHGGRIKLLDFGLARSVHADIGITQSGAILGTPAYMAPEQARGEPVDQRCDLYSLGCVLYRMATGELPIKGKSTMGLLMALALEQATPPRQINDAVPGALDDLIMRLLAKEANQRPESAKAVALELRKIEQEVAQAGPASDVTSELIALAQSVVSLEQAPPPRAASPVLPTMTDSGGTAVAEPRPTQQMPRRRLSKRLVFGLSIGIVLLAATLSAFLLLRTPPERSPLTTPPTRYRSPSKHALVFDGKSSYVALPTLKYDGTHPLTIELDIKPATLHVADFLTDFAGGGIGFVWDGKRSAKPHFAFGFGTEDKAWLVARATVDFLPQEVIHLAGVFDGKEIRTYLNGKLAQTTSLGDKKFRPSSSSFSIGANPWLIQTKPAQKDDRQSFLNFFQGTIQRIRFSKIVRYDTNFNPEGRFKNDNDTIAVYQFDEGQGDTLIDSSGNGHDGNIVGAKWFRVDEAGAP